MAIHVGMSGYSYKEWRGIFYPEKTVPGKMLRFYSRHFNTVEINSTFYHMPTEDILASWADQVPDNFIFAFKAPQIITHIKRLKNVTSETTYLLRTLSTLGNKLGPVLFQFPKSFNPAVPELKDFITRLPRTISFAFEFRSSSLPDPAILDLLREKEYSLCTPDSSENTDTEIISTAHWGYLRLRRVDYTEFELSQWLKRILSQKWGKAFVFFKHEEETGKGPDMAINFHNLVDSIKTS